MELLRRPAILTGSSRSWLVEPCTCTAASTADAHVTTEWKRRRRASSPSIISSTRATSLLANASALKAHHRNSLLSNQITVLNPSSDCQCLPNLVTKLTHSKRNHRRPSDYAGTAMRRSLCILITPKQRCVANPNLEKVATKTTMLPVNLFKIIDNPIAGTSVSVIKPPYLNSDV